MSLRKPQIIIAKQPGQYVGGRWQNGADGEPITILASVQPASISDYDEMKAEQPGRRIERMVRIYTNSQLTVAGEDNTNGDSLVWEGNRYLLVAVSPWRSTALKHFRYLAVRTTLP